MLVREVMSSTVFSVRPNTPLKEAVRALDEHLVTAMPVIDDMLRSANVECEVEVTDGVVRLTGATEAHDREIARVLAASVPGVVAVGFND